jgi:homoserine kinase
VRSYAKYLCFSNLVYFLTPVDCQYKTSTGYPPGFSFICPVSYSLHRIQGKLNSCLVQLESNPLMFTVRVPATIANMGPGFDSFGMAVNLYNQFSFERSEQDRLSFEQAQYPDKGPDNILFKAMDALYQRAGQKRPSFFVKTTGNIPMTGGLGSSSTAVIAGLVAANRQLKAGFTQEDLLNTAIEMEGHPDNVAPALLGGVLLYDTRPYALSWPTEWRILTLSPSYSVLTEDARRILPQSVTLEDSIFNLRKVSVLTYALLQRDADALKTALQDRLHQPYRRKLIREYDLLERIVLDAGAFGFIISGSGSTMAAFYPQDIQDRLVETVRKLILQQGWNMVLNDLTVDTSGAQLIA